MGYAGNTGAMSHLNLAEQQPERLDVNTPDGPLPVDVFRPAGGNGAGIVLCQEIFGITEFMRQVARRLASELGYTVFLPHFYWRQATPGEPAEAVEGGGEAALHRGMALAQGCDWGLAVDDALATVEAARNDAATGGRVALYGYCWGGGLAFAAAAAGTPDALVSYYGSALPSLLELAPDVTAPSLHHFGTADSFIPVPEQERIRASVTRDGVEWHSWEGAGHAFSNPLPDFHHREADEGAWAVTAEWLTREFPAHS